MKKFIYKKYKVHKWKECINKMRQFKNTVFNRLTAVPSRPLGANMEVLQNLLPLWL